MVKVLFYSNFCAHSKKFLEYFRNSGEAQVFKYVCVDRDRRTYQRHPWIQQMNITCVPTVIVNNMKLYGKDAFLWLNDQLQINGVQSVSGRVPENRKNKQVPGVDEKDPAFHKELKFYETKKDNQKFINTPDADGIKSIDSQYINSMDRRKKRKGDTLKARQGDNQYYQMRKELLA